MFSPGCSDFEQNLKNICRVNDSIYTVVAGNLTHIDFDELYIIEGPRFPDEVEKIIGTKYDNVLSDDTYQFIFLKDKKIKKQFDSNCLVGSFTMDHYKGYLKINRTSKLYIKRREFETNPNNSKEGSQFSYTVSLTEP
jgi:hypothetical protein